MTTTELTTRPDDHSASESSSPDEGVVETRPSQSDAMQGIDASDLLALLNDEYVCEIMAALAERPLSVQGVVGECNMSRPTAYRRLNRLEDAGIVEALTERENATTQYRLELASATFRITAEGIDGGSGRTN